MKWWLLVLLALPVGFALVWRVWLNSVYGTRLYTSAADLPDQKVAIVFGAGIRHNRPTPVLADRVKTAAALYHSGKVQKLLMTGDNSVPSHNEPEVMRLYAQELGVPNEDIILDYAGRRTYDSCYRAKAIFGVEAAILITQKFHQARAIYLCETLGVTSVGLIADIRYYPRRYRLLWNFREILASTLAWWDINIARPVPILGDKILID